MKATSNSSQILNVGDYVRTSKGNIGVITKESLVSLYKNNNDYSLDSLIAYEVKRNIADDLMNKIGGTFTEQYTACLIKIGIKEYAIYPHKLTKLDKLTIKTQQGLSIYSVVLPINDAILLIEIYDRNNIWYSIV